MPNGRGLFYFEDAEDPPPRPRLQTLLTTPALLAPVPTSLDDILHFPVESSHAYSYAHLSPNSLALRLNVLKRSLEILKDRPDWVRLLRSPGNGPDDDDQPSTPTSAEPRRSRQRLLPALRNDPDQTADNFKLSLNALSAALSAFFRPKTKRADSVPLSRPVTAHLSAVDLRAVPGAVSAVLSDVHDDFFDLKDVIDLLDRDSALLTKPDIALTLHDLSLSSKDDTRRRKEDALKTKLLFALATPFVESSALTSSLLSGSANDLNFLASPSTQQGNRPFHAILLGKHTSPQSVVTVESDFPWGFKAANDLACLMFGVLKSMIKNLTILDLIAPQFRNFVTERLTRAIMQPLRRDTGTKNIIFAGEIIAISRADKDFAWTSIWAQKKGNMIICMFEQITCDAFDVLLRCDVDQYPQPYTVASITEIAGNLMSKSSMGDTKELRTLSQSLDAALQELASSHTENVQCDWADSKAINKIRYFTMQFDGDNVPCALTSYPLEKDDTRYELKLKIHLMPYIAGMIVIDFSSHKVLSCNKAIAKNLFGVTNLVLIGETVDNIIPSFSAILKAGLDDQDSHIRIVPGLVLPEHFFRKYNAYLELGDNQTAEQRFLHSRGIKGLHRDGKHLFIDVQLRIVRPDIYVLWVTYSRHASKNIQNHLHKLSTSTPPPSTPRRQRSNSSVVNLPSQLKLFPEDEADLLEIGGSSSSEVSRHSSTRKPKRVNTFTVPVTYFKDKLFDDSKLSASRSLLRSQTNTAESSVSAGSKSMPKTHKDGTNYYKKFLEEEMLEMETRELEGKKKVSKFWPTKIGEKKRSKKFSEFQVLKKMGEGAYGKVLLAQHKEDPEYKIIIKCIDKQRILVDTWVRDRQLGTIPSEIQIMATLNHEPHPNIMRIVDYFEDPDYYYLETPIFGDPPAIDLFDYIEIKSDMTELDCQLIFNQVVLAVYHLHKQGITHRDIKDENIIVNEYGVVKLIDFGSAGYVKLGPFDVFVGTVDYALPEVLRGEKYEGKPQDIWALGILLYTMIYKENPFYNVDEIMEGELRVPFVASEALLDLIKRILTRAIDQRPNITDIAEHKWLEV